MKTLLNLLKESQHLDYRRLNIGEEDLDDTTMTPDEKRAFVEAVASYRKIGEAIYHNGNLMEAYENIKKIVETAEKLTLKETGDWFDKVTVNRHMKSMNESFKIFSSTIKEVSTLQQRLESSYDEIGEVLGKYYEIKEGNEFGAERAKAIASGDDTFNVGGKSFKVTDVDAQDKKNAEEFVGENMSNMKLGSFLKNKKRVNEANDKLMKVGATMVVGGDGSGTVKPVKMKLVSIDYLPKEDKYSYKFQGGGRTQYYTDDVLAKKLKETVNEGADKPHIKKIDSNLYYVDTPFVQYSNKFGNLIHIGGGDFTLETPNGKVYFTRALERTHKDMPVSVGRVHSMTGDAAAVKKVVALMSKKYKLEESVNEAKVIVHNEKTGEKHEVLSGKGKGDLLIAMKALQSAAPSHMKYSIKESMKDIEIEEGNEFGAERARAIAAGKDSFTVDGKTYKVTDVDPADKKNAEEFANESMKLSTLLKKKSINEATARLSDLLKQVANGSTSRIGSTKVDKKTAEKLLKIYNSGDVKMQNKFDGMSIDKVTSAFKPFMENNKLKTEVAPEGWEKTVKAMKDEPGIDNPYALAWWMKGKGYQSHKK
jgi:hypothetical protein